MLPAIAMVTASAALAVALSVRLPMAGTQAALVFAPGTSTIEMLQALARLDARMVRPGGMAGIVVAQFEADASWSALRRAGVWLPLDPVLAGGCAPSSGAASQSKRDI